MSAAFRVLQLGPFPPPWGGVQANLYSIHEFLRSRGVRCGALNLTRNRRADADEVYYPHSGAETLRLLATLPYNILHLHLGGNLSNRLLALCSVCTSLPGKKAVLSFHSGGYPGSPEGQSAAPFTLRGILFRRFDRVIAVNQAIYDMFGKFGVGADRMRLIYPHALPDRLPDAPLTPALADFFATHNPITVTVGLLEPEYDLPLQVELIGRLRQRHPRAGGIIIGSGALEPELRGLIASKPWAEHVLMPGDVDRPVTLQVIDRADVFLRTTLYDGDSVAVREALHLGTPVVASDNGMRPEGCFLIEKENLDALERAVEERLGAGGKVDRRPFGQANLEAVWRVYEELAS